MDSLSITISGLCLIIIQAKRYDTESQSVQVLIPETKGHRPRLTFSRPHRVYQDAVPLDRFFGPGGEDLLSLPLSGKRGRFLIPGNVYRRFNMKWGFAPRGSRSSQKLDQPVPADAMDWLIDAADVGLNIHQLDRITTWIELPPGRISAKNLILEDGEPMTWKYSKAEKKASLIGKEPDVRRHAMADDIVIETRGSGPMSFLWRDDGQDRKRIDFQAPIDENLELCISNDDVVDDSFGIKTANPNKDLEHLATAVGQLSDELDVPIEADEQETNGWTCPQVVLFDYTGKYLHDYEDI